jgi:hypothetical protein
MLLDSLGGLIIGLFYPSKMNSKEFILQDESERLYHFEPILWIQIRTKLQLSLIPFVWLEV